jgi:hypothetical protein
VSVATSDWGGKFAPTLHRITSIHNSQRLEEDAQITTVLHRITAQLVTEHICDDYLDLYDIIEGSALIPFIEAELTNGKTCFSHK